MKDSGIQWIGEIPENWIFGRVKNKFRFHKNIVGSDSDKYDRISLTMSGVLKRDKDDANGLQPESFDGYQIVYKDDLIFKLIDLQNVSTSRVGKSDYTGITSPAYIILSDIDNSRFSLYYFLNLWYQEVFNNIGGDGVRSAINKDDLLNIPYPILSLEEQQKIAEYLDKKCNKIDEQKVNYEKSIELLKEYKQSLTTEIVTKGLNKNTKIKDSGISWIGNIPDTWNITSISYYTTSRSGGTPDRNNPSYWTDGTIPWMASGEVNKVYIYETNEKITESAVENSNAKIIPANSIMVALNGQGKTKGMSAILKIDAACNQSLCAFQCNEKYLDYKYLFYCFQTMYKYLRSQAGDDIRDGLAASFVKKQKIPLPSLEEQKQIANYLDKECSKIDKLILYREEMIEKLDEYKKSLIYECVTGKKEIK